MWTCHDDWAFPNGWHQGRQADRLKVSILEHMKAVAAPPTCRSCRASSCPRRHAGRRSSSSRLARSDQASSGQLQGSGERGARDGVV